MRRRFEGLLKPPLSQENFDRWQLWKRRRIPSTLFLVLCFNLFLAPAVFAASGSEFTRSQAYALGLLGLIIIALSVYLFLVMFAPERF